MKLILTYGLLMISMIFMWIDSSVQNKIKLKYLFLIITSFMGLYYNLINIAGFILVFVMIIILLKKQYVPNNYLLWSFIFILSILLFLHKFPGFNNYKAVSARVISKQGLPYTMYLNFDKALVGFFILSYYNDFALKLKEWKQILNTVIRAGFFTIIVVIILSLFFEYVKFDFKLVSFLPLWMVVNLLFVCLPEEAFFRKFIQGNLSNILKFPGGQRLAVLIAALIFGLGHFAGGFKYIILSTIAGLGYGYAFKKTGKIEASILIHFLLNLIHFIFLTYPALR